MRNRRWSWFLALAAACGCAQAPADAGDDRTGERPAGDRARLEETGPALVKQFIATLREPFDAANSGALRRFVDPRYLSAHGLESGPFPIATVRTFNIFDNQITSDPQTLVIVAQTEAAAQEAFVFRTTVFEGQVYLLPLAPPDPATGAFTPWILRMKL